MAELKKCRKCGEPVQANAPFGHCPQCLLALGFGPVPEEALEPSGDSSLRTPHSALGRARSFGDYELLEQIGRGGMGIVFKARQKSLNRLVALKMILNVESASLVVMARFHLEAEAAAKLEHPNIVSTHEFGELDGQPFFSMRLIEGSNLAKQMPRLSIASVAGSKDKSTTTKALLREAQERIARLIAAIAHAIHYAHQNGVIHRDIKPTNILIDQQGQPHLTDFGIAKILAGEGGLTGTDDLLGTPSYMSPEQAAGKPATRAADIYSLGVILYELLTGRPPFRAETPLETLRRVKEEEPTHPTSLNRQADPELATICLKCLEKDPLRRYASAEAMAEDLERWLHREPIRARRTSTPQRLARWCRRKPALATVAGLLVLLSIISTLAALQLFARLTEHRLAAAQLALLSEQHRISAINANNSLDVLRRELLLDLAGLWTNSLIQYVPVTSDKMAVLRRDAPVVVPPGARSLDLTFAVYTHQKPEEMLKMMPPVLGNLEKSLARGLSQPVRIDFRIYRHYAAAQAALVSGEVHFMRIGPSSYVEAKNLNPGISLLVAQNGRVRGCIMVNTNAGVQSMKELKGKRMAFVDPSSTTGNYVPKAEMLTHGLTAGDLRGRGTNFLGSHDNVAEAVAAGAFDAGAGNASVADKFTNVPGSALHILRYLPEEFAGLPWVASATLDPAVAESIRSGLRSIKDKGILLALGNETTGFTNVLDADYNQLREVMKKAEKFDAALPRRPGTQ